MADNRDTKFRRDYSKSLAEALKEREERPRDKEALIQETYSQLCFDDPQVTGGDEACRLLAKDLAKQEGNYKISDSLVEGIKQATERTVIAGSNAAGAASLKDDDNENEEDELQWHTEGMATAAGYALLAFYCFCKIPLDCCQEEDLKQVTKKLGSFRGPKRPTKNDDELVDSLLSQSNEEDDIRIQELSKGLNEIAMQHDSDDASRQEENHEYDEVWAAESDPSDFEYESGHIYAQQHALDELNQWNEAAFDPQALSKPPLTADWSDLRQAVANLLVELSYSKLAALSPQQWKALGVTDVLSQLTLTLLLIQPENSSPTLLNDELQQLGIQPINVLRDSLAVRPNLLPDYLLLLQTLISVDAAAEVPSSKGLVPATIVGLASLSSLCATTTFVERNASTQIRQCILLTCEDLSHIVEKTTHQSNARTKAHVIWTLLPMLDRLTNICTNGTVWEASCSSLSNQDAQLLLQTGVFRELLLLYTSMSSSNTVMESDNEEKGLLEAARAKLLLSIQVMCIQSPSLLGKYAWRVPDLAKIVQTQEFATDQTVNGILWNVLGCQLAGGPVRLKLKDVPVLTAAECRLRAVEGFETLCNNVKVTMATIDRSRTKRTSMLENKNGDWKEPIEELSRLSNYLVSCPSFVTLWKEAITSDNESMQQVTKATSSLRSILSNLSRIPEPSERKMIKTADNDKAGDALERPASITYGENEEGAVRKALKILSASGGQESIEGSSKTD